MREKPILFSAPMVRAILAGTKTQTRRVVRIDDRPITKADWDSGKRQRGIPSNAVNVRMLGYLKCDAPPGSYAVSSRVECPYWELGGGRLWVRETWAPADSMAGIGDQDPPQCVAYRADKSAAIFGRDMKPREANTYAWAWERLRWRPSIHMPRWASRITLEVTAVRVERLHDITEEDAKAEGISEFAPGLFGAEAHSLTTTAWGAFIALWRKINGHDPRAVDPWVWVVSFTPTRREGE